MKKTNKKGFTLVELVIVIAVIAILAGVLIATFASVIKKANDSAEVQNVKNAEIAQKADDIIAKIEDSNWFGWEDFEASIVAKIAEVVKGSPTDYLTKEQVEAIVNDAVSTIIANKNEGNTGVSPEQIKIIVENALGTLRYEGVTEAQVRAIVKAASNEVVATELTAAQVRSIVNTANEKNLAAADIIIALRTKLEDSAKASDITTAVSNVTTAVTSATAGLATSEQAEEILRAIEEINTQQVAQDLTNVLLAKSFNIRIGQKGITSASYPTQVVSEIGDVSTTDTSSTILLVLNHGTPAFVVVKNDASGVLYDAGLTLDLSGEGYKYWAFVDNYDTNLDYSQYLLTTNQTAVTISTGIDVGNTTSITSIDYNRHDADDSREVVVRTNSSATELNVNAPADTVRHFGVAGVVDITSIAPTSYHENGTVSLAKIKNGRLVVTEEAEIAGVHVVETNGNYNGIKVAVVGNAQLPSFTRDDVELEAEQSKLVIEVQTLQQESTVPTAENTQYVWITGVGENEVSSSVSSSSTSATAAVTTESAIATAVKTEARESTSAEELEQIEEAAARYAGGIGTETKPYLIKTEQHINSLNEDVMNHLTDGVYYKLIDNLELANFKVIGSSIFTSYGPQSGEITGVDMFEGTLDGDNHYITYSTENISCSLNDGGVGFFSIIKGATIKNITFNATINTPNARNVGAVTGSIDGDDYHDVNTFENIIINGSIKGYLNVGGIAGVLAIGANVNNCVNNASIILESNSSAGYTTVGGFFGQSVLCWDKCGNSLHNHVVNFTNCVNNGSIYVSSVNNSQYYCGSNFIGFASDAYPGTYNFTNCSIGQNVTINTNLPSLLVVGQKIIRTGYTLDNYSHNNACLYIGITSNLWSAKNPVISLNINGEANDFSGYFVD